MWVSRKDAGKEWTNDSQALVVEAMPLAKRMASEDGEADPYISVQSMRPEDRVTCLAVQGSMMTDSGERK